MADFNVEAVAAVNRMAGDLVNGKKFSAAKVALCRAIAAMPENYELWANLSSVLWSLHAYEDSLQCAQTSLKCNPNQDYTRIPALVSAGNAHMAMSRYDLALIFYNEAASFRDEEHPANDARWNRCLLNLAGGNYLEAWPDHYLRAIHTGRIKDDLPGKMWEGESIHGKSLLVVHDQGTGDTIMFSRYLEEIINNYMAVQVYLQIPVELFSLFGGFEDLGIRLIPLGRNNTPRLPDVDYHCYFGDLPAIFKTTIHSIPRPSPLFLAEVNKAQEESWKSNIHVDNPRIDGSLKVGICWTGSPHHPRDDIRNIPLRLLASLAENPRIWLYSLQMGKASEEVRELGLQYFVMDFSPQIQDKGWMGTASAMMQMDVIVTCDTSVAHLGGTLGKPTWVIIPTEPYWPWGNFDARTPWYPSVRLFRQVQEQRGSWLHPVEQVRGQLVSMIEKGK